MDRLPPIAEHTKLSTIIQLPDWAKQTTDWSTPYRTDADKMALAIALSRQNVKDGQGGPFATAIFDMDSGLVLSVGVNQVMAAHNSCLHGEMMAIMLAEQRLKTFSLSENNARCELFTSCEPCAMCLGAILWSGVKRLVCAATGDDARAIGFDEGPVFSQSYTYLEKRGIQIQRQLQRDAAKAVLNSYQASGGPIYNG
ncbi:nucleoside deaminase [Bowmanella pacifica]|uniref:tRNA-specific adenosine deaminase n=1 Tax=Bowmanella pacifica TaxID=502051 RepID=A0A917YYH8_9ALTE|nr:nucleoside deaminase [Bowmanella pacifica]GGO69865.1 tRNA-specific adenosine deaminase [Bowmanella pacifica]